MNIRMKECKWFPVCPMKRFYEASPVADCPNMKLTTLEKVLWSLEDMAHEVTVPEETRRKASKAIEKMLAVG